MRCTAAPSISGEHGRRARHQPRGGAQAGGERPKLARGEVAASREREWRHQQRVAWRGGRNMRAGGKDGRELHDKERTNMYGATSPREDRAGD